MSGEIKSGDQTKASDGGAQKDAKKVREEAKSTDRTGGRDAPKAREQRSPSDKLNVPKDTKKEGEGPTSPAPTGVRDAPKAREPRRSSDKPDVAMNLKGLGDGKMPKITGIRDAPKARDSRLVDMLGRNSEARKESAERQRVAVPEHGVGFRYDSDKLSKQEFERFIKGLPAEKRDAMNRPDTLIVIRGRASRPGSESHNLDLSERRAQAVKEQLEQLDGFQAQIKIIAAGEQDAKVLGIADGKDDAHDRVAVVDIRLGSGEKEALRGNADRGIRALLYSPEFRKPENDKHVEEQFGIVKDGIKAGVKELPKAAIEGGPAGAFVRGIFAAGKEVLKKEGKFIGVNLMADQRDRPLLEKIGANVGPGFLHRLEELTGVEKTKIQSPLLNDKGAYYSAGGEMMSRIWANLPEAERKNIIAVMHSDQRAQFTHRLLEKAAHQWLRRAGVQSSRDLR